MVTTVWGGFTGDYGKESDRWGARQRTGETRGCPIARRRARGPTSGGRKPRDGGFAGRERRRTFLGGQGVM